MSEVLTLDGVSLLPEGTPLGVTLGEGEALAIAGPAAAGKSALLRVVAGIDRPARGSVRAPGGVAFAAPGALSRRARVQALARVENASSQEAATEVLSALHLWDVRTEQVGDLSPSQAAACELVEPLASRAPLVVIDGQLDALDPWVLADVQRLLRSRDYSATVIATHRPDIIEWCGRLIALQRREVRFQGTVEELLRRAGPHELIVSAQNQPAVEALVAPLDVEVRADGDAISFRVREEQELAAKLLLEGYGNVRFLVRRPSSVAEALLALIR
jgi:ABC-2 type transport system ATP-binding protein